MSRPKALVAWSSGKDSAWALHEVRLAGEVEVVGLLTTVTAGPMLRAPLAVAVGEVVEREGFVFADVLGGDRSGGRAGGPGDGR
jgi:diphthamide synthase (EF-2-diphthine--ammonia ligase)